MSYTQKVTLKSVNQNNIVERTIAMYHALEIMNEKPIGGLKKITHGMEEVNIPSLHLEDSTIVKFLGYDNHRPYFEGPSIKDLETKAETYGFKVELGKPKTLWH